MTEAEESVHGDELSASIHTFIHDLKQNNIQGSYQVAHTTLSLLCRLVEQTPSIKAPDLLKRIQETGRRMIDAQPSETAIANMVRRVLKIVREESARLLKGGEPVEGVEGEEKSLQKMFLADGGAGEEQELIPPPDINTAELVGVINELISELEASAENIAAQALEHIHSNEVILTAGKSRTVEAFLKKAAKKKRRFQVIVVECAPFYHGHELSLSLAKEGIDTTVITDSAVFAMMSRVNKVIIGTHTVMANGGLKAISGSHAIALAAKYYSVPESFSKFVSPQQVFPFTDGEIVSKVQIYNPVFDYVPPELVTLFISNIGGNAPFYIYRLVSELYSSEDQEL